MVMIEKTSPRQSYHHGDLRAKLIEATRMLVESKGPDHFSVSEACRVAGVSTAAPYKHFKDKDEMLRAVALDGMGRKNGMVAKALVNVPPGTPERIIAMGKVYTSFAISEPGVFRLMFGLSKDHDADEELVGHGKTMYDVVQQEVALCRGSDVVEDIDRHRAFMLWSFVHGLSFLQIDGKISSMNLEIDIETVIRDAAKRILSDKV